ncbi:MAG: outer membrane beta-barrel protein [Ignavibacteriae bacterium]|nr:outer membrane beta-barrel protein [Ignavibacteriota bacterium]
MDAGERFCRFIANWQITEQLYVNLNYDYGYERSGDALAVWDGVSVMGRYSVTSDIAVAVRFEEFHDRDGWSSGVAQRLGEGTLTVEMRPLAFVLTRLELRHDFSNQSVFDLGQQQFAASQSTLLAGVVIES